MDIKWKGPGGRFVPNLGAPENGQVLTGVDEDRAKELIGSGLAEQAFPPRRTKATTEEET